MKNIIVFLFVVMSISLVLNDKEEIVLIPDDAIRMRIIANSNEASDQLEKTNIKEELENIIYSIDADSTEEARTQINNAIPLMEEKLNVLNVDYKIEFGDNYFPEKEYKSVKYNEGIYESLVITLGEGIGDNWWCVVFPPLCLMESEKENINDVEYSLYINKILNKYN